MITLQAHMTIDPAFREEFLEKVKVLIAASQAEPGNISYGLYEYVEKSNRFVMIEEWEDEAAIQEHNQSPHFAEFMKFAPEALAAPVEIKRSIIQ
ncbi:monooxygenase [Paenibacillus swuensis]|uniref:Monooxygenase n=1 Tax=Paenibacillus swuensis TaxID=1178515 RepID=A0A172THV0_9BACL|nr:putative quinol monooxygenase [Paenibacillus swuensis]ANE46536.1 monooxygenase [Paenibacillus swuensis]